MVDKGKLKVRWTGVAGIEFVTDQGIILIDPFFSRIGKFQVFFRYSEPKKDVLNRYLNTIESELACIIVGHTHLDHALDVPYLAGRSDCSVIGSKSLDSLFEINGLKNRVTICEKTEKIDLSEDISVTMIPSAHGKVIMGRVPYSGDIDKNQVLPMKAPDFKHGTVFIPKVRIDSTCFMHIGTADYVESLIDGHTCDILFMCVPGWKRRKGYTSRLIDIVKPGIIVPFHFDDFSRPISKTGKLPLLPFQDMSGFVSEIKKNAPQVKIIFPGINQYMEDDLF